MMKTSVTTMRYYKLSQEIKSNSPNAEKTKHWTLCVRTSEKKVHETKDKRVQRTKAIKVVKNADLLFYLPQV